MAILTIVFLPTSASYAQFWEAVKGIAKGVGSAMLENYIDNNSSYSNEVKQSMKNDLNTINNAINTNQNAANATRDAYHGNYTGAVIQGTQTIMNAAGNYNYDTYLNSANQINNANREYKQDVQNGMNRQEALDKRNTTIGYSTAESAIELQDKIARERAEKARQQREAERQSWENANYYSEPSFSETNTKTSNSNLKEVESYYVSEKANECRSYNSNVQILTSDNSVKFLTDKGEPIYLYVLPHSNGGTCMSIYNHSDELIWLSCDRVSLVVKYYGDDFEYNYIDSCSIFMQAHTASNFKWSSVFDLPEDEKIESIKVCFVETQIK